MEVILVRDFNDLVTSIKKASVEAVNASKPMNITYGKVVSVDPIKINVDQRLNLTSKQLILTGNVKDFEVEMTIDHVTEESSGGEGDLSFASHSHRYLGKKMFTVHNGLKLGEKVIMIQVQGGQKFVVLDRVG